MPPPKEAKATKKQTTHTFNPWLLAFRVIFTFLMAATIVFIFTRSMQPGAVSTLESARVLALVNRAADALGVPALTMRQVRKLAHFSEYAVLGLWMQLCLRVYTRRYLRHIAWPLLGGLTVALADETLQLVVAGRSSSVMDIWIDFAGVSSGVLAGVLALAVFHLLGWFILGDYEEDGG